MARNFIVSVIRSISFPNELSRSRSYYDPYRRIVFSERKAEKPKILRRAFFSDVNNYKENTMPRKAAAAKGKEPVATSDLVDENAGGDAPDVAVPAKEPKKKMTKNKAAVEPVQRPKREVKNKPSYEENGDSENKRSKRRAPAKKDVKEKVAPAKKAKAEKKPANDEKPTKQKKTTKKMQEEKVEEQDDEIEEDQPEEAEAPVEEAPVAAKPRKRGAKEVVKDVEEEEEGDEEQSPPEPKKGRKPPKKQEKKEEMEPKTKKREPKPDKPQPLKNKTETDLESIDFSCSRKNALGEDWNLKISSWNVDGLRAWCKKNGAKYVQHENPDILCLQEIKCSSDKVPEELAQLEGYENKFWHVSKNNEGYAGVGILSKTEPISVKYGIDDEQQDEEGRCITVEYEQFYLVNVYVPNAGKKLVTLPKRMDWNESFHLFVKELDEKKPVIICGDMNVAHNEIDLANPKTNTKNAGFTKEEREGMGQLLELGFVDTFRELYPDDTGAYTFWTYMSNARSRNIGWRLDYFIVSNRFMEKVCDNVIRNEVYGSDHCPVTLFITV